MRTNLQYPRVLFVTPHAFNKVTGGGITFTNLFSGWPKDSLATAHCDPEPTTGDVCERYFILGQEELDYAQPFASIRQWFGGKTTQGGASGPTAVPQPVFQSCPQRTQTGLRTLTVNTATKLLGDGLPQRAHLSKRLADWIEEFQPDVIYTILGSNGMMRLVADIRDRFRLPVVVHFMDDWMSSYYRRGILAPFMRHRMETLVADAVSQAQRCLSISTAMSEAFSSRYHRTFEAFQNTIDVAKRLSRKGDLTPSQPADIIYIGSIFPNAQLDSLEACCQAVAELNKDGPVATLTISSPSGHTETYRDRLTITPEIRIIDTIREDDAFFHRIAQADLLLLPVNFSESSIRFIRYSMPTKVPAYLVSGTPILAYGPAETAQISYARGSGWAFTVTDPTRSALISGIRQAITDISARRRVVARAQQIALNNHDAVTVRSRFHSVLRAAAQAGEKTR